jgi:hypothetical protein
VVLASIPDYGYLVLGLCAGLLALGLARAIWFGAALLSGRSRRYKEVKHSIAS